MDITIRELTKNDLNRMIAIRLELLEKHPLNFGSSVEEERLFTEDKWVKRLTNPLTKTVGAFFEGNMIGLAVLSTNPRKKMKHIGIINSFYVKETYRKKGIASKLLDMIEQCAKELGIIRLHLSVMEKNCDAINLYQKHGFIEVGKELDTIYYEKEYYSLLLMSKRIDDEI